MQISQSFVSSTSASWRPSIHVIFWIKIYLNIETKTLHVCIERAQRFCEFYIYHWRAPHLRGKCANNYFISWWKFLEALLHSNLNSSESMPVWICNFFRPLNDTPNHHNGHVYTISLSRSEMLAAPRTWWCYLLAPRQPVFTVALHSVSLKGLVVSGDFLLYHRKVFVGKRDLL